MKKNIGKRIVLIYIIILLLIVFLLGYDKSSCVIKCYNNSLDSLNETIVTSQDLHEDTYYKVTWYNLYGKQLNRKIELWR